MLLLLLALLLLLLLLLLPMTTLTIQGLTCPPIIHFKFITQSAMLCYYDVRQRFYYKVLLQRATGIAKCDNFITKCDRTDLLVPLPTPTPNLLISELSQSHNELT